MFWREIAALLRTAGCESLYLYSPLHSASRKFTEGKDRDSFNFSRARFQANTEVALELFFLGECAQRP